MSSTIELKLEITRSDKSATKDQLLEWLADQNIQNIVEGFIDGIDQPVADLATDDPFADDLSPICVYLEELQQAKELEKKIKARFGDLHTSIKSIRNEAWEQAWTEQAQNFETELFRVVVDGTSEAKKSSDKIIVHIDAGTTFGDGRHATTVATIQAMESKDLPAMESMLDMGTGSGVLAIVGAKLGATRVLGTDLDQEIVDTARNNCVKNQVSCSLVVATDIPPLTKPFDTIVSNILVPELHRLAPQFSQFTQPGSHLILAGFTDSDESRLTEHLQTFRFQKIAQLDVRGWLAVTYKRV